MMSIKTRALSCAFPVSLALSLLTGMPAAAQPTSSPAEQVQTRQLNQDVTNANAAADAENVERTATYQAQQKTYQEQLARYRVGQQNYEERAAQYLAARDRYIAGHARFHRAAWPLSSSRRLIVDTDDLLGADVHTANGYMVGHVVELALLSGHVTALRVTLDNNRGDIWVESADMRFNADKKVVMTNLDRRDLWEMTHESY